MSTGPVPRTSVAVLAAVAAVCLVAGRLLPSLLDRVDVHPPQVGWAPAVALVVGALVLGVLAWNTWQSLHKRHERMTSDHGVKLLALAKASSLVGAIVAGGYAGYAIAFARSWQTPLGQDRVVHSGAAAVGAVLLVVAALLLERALRVPGDGDEDEHGKSPAPDATPA